MSKILETQPNGVMYAQDGKIHWIKTVVAPTEDVEYSFSNIPAVFSNCVLDFSGIPVADCCDHCTEQRKKSPAGV